MGFKQFFARTIKDIGAILQNKSFSHSKLLLAYANIVFHKYFFKKGFVSIFGKKFFYNNYNWFLSCFEDIFLKEDYYFKADNPSPIIIDAGANMGVATFYFKSLYPNAEIIAFEPDKKCFSILKQNVEKNNFKNIKIFEMAVARKSGTTNFSGDAFFSGSGGIVGRGKETIKTTNLSKFISGEIDMLKLDVEGTEQEILQELDETKKLRLIKNICFEYHSGMKNNSLPLILEILEKNNFDYFLIGIDYRNYDFKAKGNVIIAKNANEKL